MNPGVLYFLVGERGRRRYLHSIKLSAESLKTHMPQLKICLFTDLDLGGLSHFDTIIRTNPCRRGELWTYKWEECLMKSPYNPTLHLDADTYICEGFPEVFDLLNRFDLVMPLSPHYGFKKRRWQKIPSCFPELAGGFMLWKNSSNIEWFFNRTLELIKMRLTKRGDEPYLIKALYESDVRYAIIPWEYTCVFAQPGYLFGKVKVMHGRFTNDIVKDAEIFNQNTNKRIFTGEVLLQLDVKRRISKIKKMITYR